MAEEARPSERGFARVHLEEAPEPRRVSDAEIDAAYAKLQATFRSGRTKSCEWRLAQLQGLRRLCAENSDEVAVALKGDLGRPRMEAVLGDVAAILGEVDFAIANLRTWMKPERVATQATQQPASSAILREPKGVVLQLAPWNFPMNLAISPLVPALAAGNCVLVKPSEVSPQSEGLLARLLPKYVDPEAVIVLPGGVAESTRLLQLKWDHIMYTGNGAVARHVARAAAEHLTPVTLELGGKSPTLVLPGANVPVAMKRILAGKFFNCGQMCISPDYALVHKAVLAEVVQESQRVLKDWYGDDAAASPSFGRIINERHFDRISSLLASSGGRVLAQQGTPDRASRFMPPTLLEVTGAGSPIMQEEIFGPLLPILPMDSVDSMVEHVNAGEKPLAMYIFGKRGAAEEIISRTSSGGVCVNDTVYHITNPHLPFGGVGGSGVGRYHGKFGFDEFSHLRGVMYRAAWLDLPQRYPPYTEANLRMFERLIVGPMLPPGAKLALGAGVAGAAVAAAIYATSRRR